MEHLHSSASERARTLATTRANSSVKLRTGSATLMEWLAPYPCVITLCMPVHKACFKRAMLDAYFCSQKLHSIPPTSW